MRRFLITDFDNTLYDWFDMWRASFQAMLAEVELITDLPRAQLLAEMRKVHQLHKTSEYAFLLNEVPSLVAFSGGNTGAVFGPAIEAYKRAGDAHLRLYDGVARAMERLRSLGVVIAVYTESQSAYTEYRIQRLGLDSLVDFVYSPRTHGMSETVASEAGWYPSSEGSLAHVEHRFLPFGLTKPNPVVLADIIQELGAETDQCAYVGDSLLKDVAMAQQAGVLDILASYGESQSRSEYNLLREVSHWPDIDVDTERSLSPGTVTPTHIIDRFPYILRLFGDSDDRGRA